MNLDDIHSRDSVSDNIRYAFRERQVYVRSDNTLRYLIIRPWHLIAASCLCCAAFAWITVASVTFLFKERQVTDARSKTQQVQVHYEGRLATIQSAVTKLSSKLMLDQGAYLAKVDELRNDFVQLIDRHDRLEVFFKQGWLPIQAMENEASGASEPQTNSSLQDEDRTNQPLLRLTVAPQGGYKTHADAQQPLHDLRLQLAKLEKQQIFLVDRIIAHGEKKAAILRGVFTNIGLDPKHIAQGMKLPRNSIGGPLLPVQKGQKPQDSMDRKLLSAHMKFSEVEKLRHAISLMPVRLPFKDGYRLTSGFGFRKDPFNNVLARHTGVDLMAPYGTPIKATAAGLVIRAEMDDAYGRVVDIQHDNGIMTRYAHMSVIEVKVGERVAVHHFIGRVGTSGRSTGPHLHYETRVNKKPIDPYQFLRIVRDVL